MNNDMSVLVQNVRSLNANFEELEIIAMNKSPSVICIQETWQFRGNPLIKGYQTPLLILRGNNKRGGGVGCWVKDNIIFEELSVKNYYVEEFFECAAIKVGKHGILNFYRIPNTPINVTLQSIAKFKQECDKMKLIPIIAGDCNINFSDGTKSKGLKKILADLDLKQIVRSTTREIGGKLNIIDHCYVPIFVRTKHSIILNNLSDHNGILVKLKGNPINKKSAPTPTVSGFSYTPEKIAPIKQCLLNQNWNEWSQKNCETMAKDLNNLIESEVHKNCKIKFKLKKGDFWFNNKLKNLRIKCIKSHKLAKRTKSLVDWEIYNHYKKKYKKMVKEEKSQFYADKLKNCDSPRKKWNILKEISHIAVNKQPPPNTLTHNGHSASSPTDVANLFNDFYSKIAADLDKKLPQAKPSFKPTFPRTTSKFSLETLTNYDVLLAIEALKPKKSFSEDCISNKLIKCLKYELLTPLKILFEKCLASCTFPEIWKNSKIIPLYKKGPKQDPGNYRPISLLPVISKVFEKCLCKKIYEYFESNKLFSKNQHGFRAGRSTTTALTDFLSSISTKKPYCAVMIDFSKAFDTIQPRKMADKLRNYGFSPELCKLILNYLTNRKQFVYLDGTKSNKIKAAEIGTPQGSCLSPLLFLIYINCFHPKAKFLLFADDTAIIFYGKDRAELELNIRNGLDYCDQYFKHNRLSINVKKTFFLCNIDINCPKINNQEIVKINNTNQFKYLGVEISGFPKMSNHISSVVNKLQKGLIALHRIKKSTTFTCRKEVYYAFFHSHINYALATWGPLLSKADLQTLQTAQKKAIRLVFGKRLVHTSNLFKEAKILKIQDCIKLNCIVEGFNGLILKKHDVYTDSCYKKGGNLRSKEDWMSEKSIFKLFCEETNAATKNNLFEKVKSLKGIKLPSSNCIKNRFLKQTLESYTFICRTANCYVCNRA